MSEFSSHAFYATSLQAWDAMFQEILLATQSIYWEVYSFVDDAVGLRFVELLAEKARAGVEVKLIVDAIGSSQLSRQASSRLKNAGVELMRYHRLYPGVAIGHWWRRVWHRNHRKLLIIDRKIVFIGGVNVAEAARGWDDIFVRLTGVAMAPLLRGFAASFLQAGGSKRDALHLFYPKMLNEPESRNEKVRFIFRSPYQRRFSNIKRMFHQSVHTAREHMNLLTPYFVPSQAFLKRLHAAHRRGVEVNIFLPLKSDVRLLHWISRAYHGILHELGARVYLLPTMNHGKAFSVDNQYGFVGSSNFTPRSFYFNEEAGVYFSDQNMVADLNNLFARWKTSALPFDKALWHSRGWWKRFTEWWAQRIERIV